MLLNDLFVPPLVRVKAKTRRFSKTVFIVDGIPYLHLLPTLLGWLQTIETDTR